MLKYEMIVNDLQKRIMNEEFEENHKLPTEEKLIEEYKVSRNTIRNAIKILINLGNCLFSSGEWDVCSCA